MIKKDENATFKHDTNQYTLDQTNKTSKDPNNKPFYQKNWFIILTLIIFFPVGLFLMWKYSNWHKAAKIIVTSLFCLIIVFGIIDDSEEPISSQTASQQKSDKEINDKKTIKDDKKDDDVVDKKAAAIETDKKIYEIVLAAEKTSNTLNEGMSLVGNGQGSLLDLYDLAKAAKENHFSYYSALSKLQNKKNKDYIEAAQLYVINSQNIAEDIMKYIDKNEMKYLSRAKENMQSVSNYVLALAGTRMEYLSNQGLTDDEIVTILDSESAE